MAAPRWSAYVTEAAADPDNKVYMLRTYANSAHEIWDVTNPTQSCGGAHRRTGQPCPWSANERPGALAGTHKSWWECDTGIAYIVGRRGNDTADGWGRATTYSFLIQAIPPTPSICATGLLMDSSQVENPTPLHSGTLDPWPDFNRTCRRRRRVGGRHR